MKQSKRLQSSLVRNDAKARRVQPKIITNFTSRPFESSLADFCTFALLKTLKINFGYPQKSRWSNSQKSRSQGENFHLASILDSIVLKKVQLYSIDLKYCNVWGQIFFFCNVGVQKYFLPILWARTRRS